MECVDFCFLNWKHKNSIPKQVPQIFSGPRLKEIENKFASKYLPCDCAEATPRIGLQSSYIFQIASLSLCKLQIIDTRLSQLSDPHPHGSDESLIIRVTPTSPEAAALGFLLKLLIKRKINLPDSVLQGSIFP